jgi:hypothetical protein
MSQEKAYNENELDAMLDALHDAIDELELNLNTVDDMPEARQAYIEQLEQLSKINNLLNSLKTND